MSQTGIASVDTAVHTTNIWVNGILHRLGWIDRHRAYQALRAVLHALRDRLPVDQAAALAAQLPTLIRGVFYEGWHPHGKPLKEGRDEFLAHIARVCGDDPGVTPAEVVRAVLRVLAAHVTAGEVESVKQCLPERIRTLWP